MLRIQCLNEMRSKCEYRSLKYERMNDAMMQMFTKSLKYQSFFLGFLFMSDDLNAFSFTEVQISLLCRRMYSKRSHYDVLNVRKNCSTDDIRLSFAKLSKKVNIHGI